MADSSEAADLLFKRVPNIDSDLASYLGSYLSDEASCQTLAIDGDGELASLLEPALEENGVAGDDMQQLMEGIKDLMLQSVGGKNEAGSANKAKALDKVVNLNHNAANTVMPGSVDISSTSKGRNTQVDLAKLEKAEAKLKAKADKRAAKTGMNLYQGSKLVDDSKRQQQYEENFMRVNPLSAIIGAGRTKTKDVHLDNIDCSFGSLRILSGANLTLSYGRRYGLIGRNGIGKTSLLRQIAFREVPVPEHISILYVDQEAHGDDTPAIQCVLSADVWREKFLRDEREINNTLNDPSVDEKTKDKASERLGEVHQMLLEIDAETGPARAAELLYGLGFNESDQQKPTRTFSGGWRMRLSLARALFVKPDILLLDEPSNNLDLVALAWLENYLATSWEGTVLVVSHDRAFLDIVGTDIIHQHNQRLDYYKGNFTQFYATKEERALQQKREYDAQQMFRANLQAFIDRWRYNAARASQAQMKIKVLEKLPELEPPEDETTTKFTFRDADKLSPPLLQLDEVSFAYESTGRKVLTGVNIDIGLDSRLGLIGPNGAGKSTLLKLLIGELEPTAGKVNRNGRLRVAYFAQHQIDALDLDVSPVAYLAKMFPGQSEQAYRAQLGAFGITGPTGLQNMATLSGGQKSRVAFAILSMQQPHLLIIDEPTNHLDIQAHDSLSDALNRFNGGVLVVSHDERFISNVCKELWIVADGQCKKHYGDVSSYKKLILQNAKARPN